MNVEIVPLRPNDGLGLRSYSGSRDNNLLPIFLGITFMKDIIEDVSHMLESGYENGEFLFLCLFLPFGAWIWLPLHVIGMFVSEARK